MKHRASFAHIKWTPLLAVHRNEFENGRGAYVRLEVPEKTFVAPLFPLFRCTSTISRFCERIVMVIHYSLASSLFAVFLLTVPFPRAQSFVKVGARAPVPYGVGAGPANQLTSLLSFHF